MMSHQLIFIVISLTSAFVSALTNQSLTNWRRIGGRQYEAKDYPPYLIEIRIWFYIAGEFRHQCMGTLLSQIWSLSAVHCFPEYIDIKDFTIFYGSVHRDEALPYEVKAIKRHETDNLALVKHSRILIQTQNIPKLTTTFCRAEVRAVYHSFGKNDEDGTPGQLLFSTTEVNEELCKTKTGAKVTKQNICFKSVDLSFSRKGDGGSGMITGYGPGPIFSDKHNVKIIGVLIGDLIGNSSNTNTPEEVNLARRVSEYIPWIQRFVPDVQIVDE